MVHNYKEMQMLSISHTQLNLKQMVQINDFVK